MPEALVAVPRLQIPTDNSSEYENSSANTDRSVDSRNGNRRMRNGEKRLPLQVHTRSKWRTSYGRRFQKKTLRPLASEQVVTASQKSKSHVPTALAETSTFKSICQHSDSIESNRSQQILLFRQRKSVSQMDFSQALRERNKLETVVNSKLSLRENCESNMAVGYSNTSFVHKMFNKNAIGSLAKSDSQMAGLRIFGIIMLNAWRRRRDEVKNLMNEVAVLKRANVRSKTQLHVFNTLFRVEQKRNDELNGRLKTSLEDINVTKSSYEGLSTSVMSLQADKSLLEQQLSLKEQEFETVNTLLTQTKEDLVQSVNTQKELQALLSQEQEKNRALESQKNELINEVCDLNAEAKQQQDDLLYEIATRNEEISEMEAKLNAKEEEIKTLNQSIEQQLCASKAREKNLQEEKVALEKELKIMQKCLEATIGKRLKNCLKTSMAYQNDAVNLCHWLLFYVLPATPPPRPISLPFSLSFNKVLSVIRR